MEHANHLVSNPHNQTGLIGIPAGSVSHGLHPLHGANHVQPMHPALAIFLLYGTMFMMLGAQTGLFWWKNKHKKSYDLVRGGDEPREGVQGSALRQMAAMHACMGLGGNRIGATWRSSVIWRGGKEGAQGGLTQAWRYFTSPSASFIRRHLCMSGGIAWRISSVPACIRMHAASCRNHREALHGGA